MKSFSCFASLLLFLMLLLVVGACGPQVTQLPFETIEQQDMTLLGQSRFEAREPELNVIAQPEDIVSLNNWVTHEAQVQLQTLDYNSQFVLIVFQVWKPVTGYGVKIERIERQGTAVTIVAEFQTPKPGIARGELVTSPYELVRVQKVGKWGQLIRFDLVVDGNVIASTSHNI